MADLQTELNLAADVQKLRDVAEAEGWEIDGPHGLTVFVTMTSSIDDNSYCIRFECSGYPDQPFSVKPVDPETKESGVVRAWPACEGFRPPNDLCMPLCREGYALHPEWTKDPRWRWDSTGNPLHRVVDELQARIDDSAKYQGRAA